MTNLEKLIETLRNAPIENTACFIARGYDDACNMCIYRKECTLGVEYNCEQGVKEWLESEDDNG